MKTRYRVARGFQGYDQKWHEVGEFGEVPECTHGTFWLGDGEVPLTFDGEHTIGVHEDNLELVEGVPYETSI
jgi:hypothetical protein